jgi:hypothetical protein
MDEMLRLIVSGRVDARILLDPSLPMLPGVHNTYAWNPEFRSGAPSFRIQLETLDHREPWRALFVGTPEFHPVFRFGYDEELGGAFTGPFSSPPMLRPPRDARRDSALRLRGRMHPVDNDAIAAWVDAGSTTPAPYHALAGASVASALPTTAPPTPGGGSETT